MQQMLHWSPTAWRCVHLQTLAKCCTTGASAKCSTIGAGASRAAPPGEMWLELVLHPPQLLVKSTIGTGASDMLHHWSPVLQQVAACAALRWCKLFWCWRQCCAQCRTSRKCSTTSTTLVMFALQEFATCISPCVAPLKPVMRARQDLAKVTGVVGERPASQEIRGTRYRIQVLSSTRSSSQHLSKATSRSSFSSRRT